MGRLDCICGKKQTYSILSKITMPVVFNEPLSFLQRISEYLEYAKLLEQANLSDDPVERLQVNGQKFPSVLCD
jgi:hypothetical protein